MNVKRVARSACERWLLLAGCALLALPSLGAAAHFETLVAGNKTYRNVRVLSYNAQSLSIHHEGGLSQIPLSDLKPELQDRYGYQQIEARQRARELERLREQQSATSADRLQRERQERKKRASGEGTSAALAEVIARFGRPPDLRGEVDMREDFRRHSLAVRNQGIRPSCAIHSVVAALEYQYAEYKGAAIDVSEAKLFEATTELVSSMRALPQSGADDGNAGAPVDVGFSLEEVFLSVRRFGLVMEENVAARMSQAEQDQLTSARFTPFRLPGSSSEAVIENAAHVLNARMPVVMSLSWPAAGAIRHTSLLSEQTPRQGAGHAVTLVGYRSPDGKLENAKFIFRNSWGSNWGAGGYGFATYDYIRRNLHACYVVELH